MAHFLVMSLCLGTTMLKKGEGGKRSVEADLRFVVPAPFSGPRGAARVSLWRGAGEGPRRRLPARHCLM